MAKENTQPNSYIYHRQWFNFQHENMQHVTANHIALYLYVVEINNRLGWVKSFGLTVREGMDGMRCKSRNTYLNTFHDLTDWGFFKVVKPAKNQYVCNVIALPIFKQAKITFFDKSVIINNEINKNSLIKNYTGTDTSNGSGTDTSNGSGTDTSNGSGTDTIHQTNLPLNQQPLNNNIIDFLDAINFFDSTKLKGVVSERYNFDREKIEKKFTEFWDSKIDLGKFNNKNAAEISEYFSNWLPNNLTSENKFKNQNNGKETTGSITAIVNATKSARDKAIANLNPDGSFR